MKIIKWLYQKVKNWLLSRVLKFITKTRPFKKIIGMIQATFLILMDQDFFPGTADIGVLIGHAQGDFNEPLIELVSQSYKNREVPTILLNAEDNVPTWPGYTSFRKALDAVGVEHFDDFGIASYTVAEAQKIAEYCKRHNYTTILCYAQPHRLLRLVAALIESSKKTNHQLTIHCKWPKCNFSVKVYGSQGKVYTKRLCHVATEYIAVFTYLHGLSSMQEVISHFESKY